ncbi:hypothetical protein VTG60DRAFT_3059 [Thermothelomyces hinnuleus]
MRDIFVHIYIQGNHIALGLAVAGTISRLNCPICAVAGRATLAKEASGEAAAAVPDWSDRPVRWSVQGQVLGVDGDRDEGRVHQEYSISCILTLTAARPIQRLPGSTFVCTQPTALEETGPPSMFNTNTMNNGPRHQFVEKHIDRSWREPRLDS